MLDLYNILWTVPGIVFIYTYNKKKPLASIGTSGWAYIFAILCVSCLIWLPFYAIFESCDYFKPDHMKPVKLWALSICTAAVGHLLARLLTVFSASQRLFPQLNDTFCINFIKWEKETVIVNLKNGKVCAGLLIKYPENLNDSMDRQAISILPFYSGWREPHTGKVVWRVDFLDKEKQGAEIVIPRSEILTMAKFERSVFVRLNPQFE